MLANGSTTFFDEKVVCNSEFVSLRSCANPKDNTFKNSGIYFTDNDFVNSKLGLYVVENLGEKAKEETGLEIGDYVLADKLAIFYKSYPVGILRYDNIIVKTNADKSEFYPMKDKVFVKVGGNVSKIEQNESEDDYVDFVIPQHLDKNSPKTGFVTAFNVKNKDNFKLAVGDEVLLSRLADAVELPSGDTILIYNYPDILCKICR